MARRSAAPHQLSGYFIRGRNHKAQITENVLAGDLPTLVSSLAGI